MAGSRSWWLILDTSQRLGRVALANQSRVVSEGTLAESRRHARDLVPRAAELCDRAGIRPTELTGVIVSRGPGSYTGLRVGMMAAKTLAHTTRCKLLAIDTFAAVARQTTDALVEVIADAQQDRVYVQRFREGKPDAPLHIENVEDWATQLASNVVISGPGLALYAEKLAGRQLAPPEAWLPQPAALLTLGLARHARGESDDPLTVEPLYLRVSAAEEQWAKLGRA